MTKSNSNNNTSNSAKKNNKQEKIPKSSSKVEDEVVEQKKSDAGKVDKMIKREVTLVSQQTLDYPLFCCAAGGSSALAVCAGGGGVSKTGIPNGLTVFKWVGGQLEQLGKLPTPDYIPNISIHPSSDQIAFGSSNSCFIYDYNLKTQSFTSLKSFVSIGCADDTENDTNSGNSASEQEKDKEQQQDQDKKKKKQPLKESNNSVQSASTVTSNNSSLCKTKRKIISNEKPTQQTVRYSRNGDRLVTGGTDGSINIWKVPKYTRENSFYAEHCDEITDIDIHPNNSHLVTTSKDKSCHIWNLISGKVEFALKSRMEGTDLVFRGCRFSPDGLFVYTVQGIPRGKNVNGITAITRWNLSNGADEKTVKIHTAHPTCFDISHDGKYLAIGTADSYITVVDTETFKRVDRWEPHDFVITSISFSPDNRSVLSVSADYSLKAHRIGSGTKELDYKLIFTLTFFILIIAIFYKYFTNNLI